MSFTTRNVKICVSKKKKQEKKKRFRRGHPDLNQGPLDLQSNALPLSYTPNLLVVVDNDQFINSTSVNGFARARVHNVNYIISTHKIGTVIKIRDIIIILLSYLTIHTFLQFISRYHPEELAVFLEQLVGLRSFLERNPKLFATASEKLR